MIPTLSFPMVSVAINLLSLQAVVTVLLGVLCTRCGPEPAMMDDPQAAALELKARYQLATNGGVTPVTSVDAVLGVESSEADLNGCDFGRWTPAEVMLPDAFERDLLQQFQALSCQQERK